ncbi:MAG: tetratricopeptide repeat protein [Sulfuritalea sp.]|nr:tetratricopeptide repeat protein [Sulfuritalea sp.]
MCWEEAIPEFRSALVLMPDDFEILKNLGVAFFRLHRWNDAVPCLLKAIELHPGDYVDAIEVLAKCLFHSRRLDEAIVVCRSLCEAFPDAPNHLQRLINVELYRCSWSGIGQQLTKWNALVESQVCVANPWELFKFWNIGMHGYRRLAEGFAEAMIPASVRLNRHDVPATWQPNARTLRVAYMSSDFSEHPVGFVIAEVIERHDRQKVEVFGYSLLADDGSQQRKRLESAFDRFVDVGDLSVRATADRIRADGIDILVDLNGWTGSGRAESLALRCAPVQVSWLGYAGTLGLSLLADYVIGDREVTPLEDQAWFTERIVQMPHSYMPVDTRHAVSAVPARQSQGLAEDAFVLCSFNNNYKFNPPLFDIWCALLRQMPGAVLWLLKCNDTAIGNLRREAEQRDVAAERLVFAPRVAARADYLARLRLADLALDTFPYNSHSTGVDALVAGVPLVTKRGDTFPGRVGASVMMAAGLPELIADDDAGYAALVLDLYRDRDRLAGVRQKLAAARDTAPLFDMVRFARDLEGLYYQMASEASDRAAGTDATPPQAPARAA